MSADKNMAELAKLTQITFQAAQTEMSKLQNRELQLLQHLDQLDEKKQKRAETVEKTPDAALIAGVDFRWHFWIDRQRAKINEELAQIRALKERSQSQLRSSYGRDQIAKALSNNLRKNDQRQKSRRSTYAS